MTLSLWNFGWFCEAKSRLLKGQKPLINQYKTPFERFIFQTYPSVSYCVFIIASQAMDVNLKS